MHFVSLACAPYRGALCDGVVSFHAWRAFGAVRIDMELTLVSGTQKRFFLIFFISA